MPAKRLTPGVYGTEVDISEVVSPVGTSTGGVVIRTYKGPIARPVLVTSQKEFVDTFGSPVFVSGTTSADTDTPEYGYGSYAALEFLKESRFLYVVRDYDTNDRFSSLIFDTNGSTSGLTSGIAASADSNNPDKINEIYALDQYSLTGKTLLIGSVGPGTDGNNLAVTVQTFSSACDWFNSYDTYSSATDTSAHPIGSQVFKIQVYSKGSTETWANIAFSAISASPIETWYGTRSSVLDGNNNQLKIDQVVNGYSKYIYVKPGTGDFTGTTLNTVTTVTPLLGGTVAIGTNIGITDGWSYFNNKEDVDVNILIIPDYSMNVKTYVANIAATRRDCIAVGQTGQRSRNTVATVKTDETYGYTNPSYMALYGGWTKIYDTYNDKNVYIPNSIIGAELMARVDRIANVWEAPAGINNGVIGSLTQNVRFSFDNIGLLYEANINTPRFIKNVGDVMWGQKTAQMKKSALDRINVRRLLIYINSTIETSLLPFLFQMNNSATRLRVSSILDSFLSGVRAAGGLNAYTIVCNETNNTSQIIDSNILAVDIFCQPVRIIEFIELKTIITRTGVSIAEIV